MTPQKPRQQRGYILPLILLASTAVSLPLTVSGLAQKIVSPVHPPSQPTIAVIAELSSYCTQGLRIPVGPPDAVLSAIIVEPQRKQGSAKAHASESCPGNAAHGNSAKATLLLLPGYGLPKATLLPYSTLFAEYDYRSVLIDLRAQGQSTGNHIGYGKQEARDLAQVIHYLHQHGFVSGKLGLFGISYGAAVALDTAAIESRVSAVVAVAPFARVAPTIHRFIQISDPTLAVDIPGDLFKKAIAEAGQLVGYPLNDSDPLRAVSKIQAPVLYFAGAEDTVAPLHAVQALTAKTRHAHLVVEANVNHTLLASDPALIEMYSLRWFNRVLFPRK